MTTIDEKQFPFGCTGDACKGDIILFTEGVFGGSYRNPKFLGDRRVVARIVSDSYGGDKQQHTFSLEVIASDGYDALKPGSKTRRKGRNIYRNGTLRQAWDNEADRKAALDEKHGRGAVARQERDIRKAEQGYYG